MTTRPGSSDATVMIGRVVLPLAVAVLSGACFLPSLGGAFLNWDDNVNFVGNRAYRGLGPEQIRWALGSVLFGHYIPLTRLTWSANYALGGMNPWGYHLVNIALHAANTVLFYFVARRLLAAAVTGGTQPAGREPEISGAAAVAALVFGTHPLRVEAVAWITGRADVLCATFTLVAVWAYLRAVEDEGTPPRGPLLVSTVAFAAALLSKGVALPLPAALLLLDVYPLRRFGRCGARAMISEKVPLLVVMLTGAIVVAYAVNQGAVLTSSSTYDPIARLAALTYSCVVSLGRFLWPVSLSPLYEMPRQITLTDPPFALAAVGAGLITAALIALRRRSPGPLAAWAFSALMLAPTSAALRQGVDLAPDRYSYLAGLGYAVLLGGAVLAVTRLVRRGVLSRGLAGVMVLAALLVLAGFGATTWSYAEIWKDSDTLWHWAVEVNPECSVCQGKLAESLLGASGGPARMAEAEAMFRRAIALRPDLPEAYFNLGTALVIQGRYADAEAPLRAYMERVPQAAAGPERLGLLYLLERRYEAAVPHLRSALQRRPDAPGLRGSLAVALEGRARELRDEGRAADADALVAEARSLDTGGAARPPR